MTGDRLNTNSRAMTDALDSFSRIVDETRGSASTCSIPTAACYRVPPAARRAR